MATKRTGYSSSRKPVNRGIVRYIDYDEFEPGSRNIAAEIHRLRMNMLVHSCLYYQLDQNVLTDMQFDRMAYRLADLQREYPVVSKRVPNYEFFKEWDGSTGFNLPLDDTQLIEKSLYIRRICNK